MHGSPHVPLTTPGPGQLFPTTWFTPHHYPLTVESPSLVRYGFFILRSLVTLPTLKVTLVWFIVAFTHHSVLQPRPAIAWKRLFGYDRSRCVRSVHRFGVRCGFFVCVYRWKTLRWSTSSKKVALPRSVGTLVHHTLYPRFYAPSYIFARSVYWFTTHAILRLLESLHVHLFTLRFRCRLRFRWLPHWIARASRSLHSFGRPAFTHDSHICLVTVPFAKNHHLRYTTLPSLGPHHIRCTVPLHACLTTDTSRLGTLTFERRPILINRKLISKCGAKTWQYYVSIRQTMTSASACDENGNQQHQSINSDVGNRPINRSVASKWRQSSTANDDDGNQRDDAIDGI